MSVGSVVVVVIALVLLAMATLILQRRVINPWPAILVVMVTCGVAFTVGGASDVDNGDPDMATVVAAILGLCSVAAAILALVPRPRDSALTWLPVWLASGATIAGAVALVVYEFVT